MGYTGVVAMEDWAKADSDAALDAFITAFSHSHQSGVSSSLELTPLLVHGE